MHGTRHTNKRLGVAGMNNQRVLYNFKASKQQLETCLLTCLLLFYLLAYLLSCLLAGLLACLLACLLAYLLLFYLLAYLLACLLGARLVEQLSCLVFCHYARRLVAILKSVDLPHRRFVGWC